MAKTLSQLRTHARVYLDEVSEADWTDAQINRELNYAYMEMYSAVVDTYEDYYREEVEQDLVANQQQYDLPSDFYKLKRLEVAYDTGERFKAANFDFMQHRRQIDSTLYGTTSHPRYEITGTALRLMPTPTTNVTDGLFMIYIKTLSELDEDDDPINIPFPDRFGRYIVLGACAQLLRKGQQEESVALQYQNDFMVGLEKMKQELEDRYLDGVKRILDTEQEWNDFASVNSYGSIGR